MITLQKDQRQTPENLVKRMFYSKEVTTPAMVIGKKWKKKAIEKYKTAVGKHHLGFMVHKCGLFVGNAIYIGASPDGIVACGCHGNGVLEVKCATKFWNQDPKSKEFIEKLPYLRYEAGNINLNKKHKYYSQVQFQMGITGRNWCDFVVFTSLCMADEVSPLVVKVPFDEHHFINLTTMAKEFWYKYILPEILCGHLKETAVENVVMSEDTHVPVCDSHIIDHMYSLNLDIDNSMNSTCPVCHAVCHDQENVKTFNERSIACDQCNTWFHFRCIKMTQKKLRDLEGHNWYCSLCCHE